MQLQMIDKVNFIVSIIGTRQYSVTIPRVLANELGWVKGDKVAISMDGNNLKLERAVR